MKGILLTIVALLAITSFGKAAREIPGFTYLGSVGNSNSGIGIASLSNLYLSNAMSTQRLSDSSCDSIGSGSALLSITDNQKDDQVKGFLLRAGATQVWTSGFLHNGEWKWGTGIRISNNLTPNWLNSNSPPPPLPGYGVTYAAWNKLDCGLSVMPVGQMLPYVCETPAD